jgi:uroporphyrinogen-III synthase
VTRVAVYRRIGTGADPSDIDPRRYAAAVVSSVAGGAALAAIGHPGAGADIRRLRLIVPSERVADAMRAMGFVRVTASDGAGPAAVVRALASVSEGTDGG